MYNEFFCPMQIQTVSKNVTKLITEFKPTENLRKYIYCYWVTPHLFDKTNISINQSINLKDEIVLPDGCIDLIIGIDREGNNCRKILVGTMTKGKVVNMEYNHFHYFGVRFYPGGLQAFINESAKGFTDKMEEINTIGQDVLKKFTEEISNIQGDYNKVRFANQFFTVRLKQSIPWEDKFQNMLFHIYSKNANLKVKDLAQHEVISEKQVTRIFQNRVGINAKEFIKIVRFQKAFKLIINSQQTFKLVDIALEAGYYDQSHFIHEYYNYSGVKPSEHLKE